MARADQVTSITDGAKLKAGRTRLKGIAGIKEVAISIDGGKTWIPARLGKKPVRVTAA